MRADTMPLDHTLYETIQHGQNDFPIQFYVDELHKFLNRKVPLHWHFEPEFFVARGGTVKVQVGNHCIELCPDDGIFINSNALHSFEQVYDNDRCKCPNIVFSAELIAPHTSILYQKYIRPILINRSMPYFILHSEIPWQREILDELSYVFALLQEFGLQSPYGSFSALDFNIENLSATCFEMQVQCHLNQIWQSIFNHVEQIPAVAQDQRDIQFQVRVQQMISFIQRNYMNPVTLQDISMSANISKSEASRCFQSYLNCSPIEYLLQSRIEASQRLLYDTTQSIQEICSECGFNSSSYFIKVFREKVGMTPGEYRKK
ncbi:Melibiose operon regulatory protein [compost metagenome]